MSSVGYTVGTSAAVTLTGGDGEDDAHGHYARPVRWGAPQGPGVVSWV